jgi:hypothetical protein
MMTETIGNVKTLNYIKFKKNNSIKKFVERNITCILHYADSQIKLNFLSEILKCPASLRKYQARILILIFVTKSLQRHLTPKFCLFPSFLYASSDV